MYKPVAAAALSPLVGPSGEMKGLFLEEDGLWLSNNAGGGAVLRRLPASSLDWTPADFRALRFTTTYPPIPTVAMLRAKLPERA